MSTRAQRKAYAARQQASRNEFLWREGVRREAQLQRDFHRDAAAADDIRDKTSEKVKSIYVKAETDAGRAIERIEREFGAEEKRILTKERITLTGATHGVEERIIVWHWKVPMPAPLRDRLGVARSDVGAICALRPGGGLVTTDSAPDALIQEDPSLIGDPDFIDWATSVAGEWDALVRDYGALLARLRDDEWWAQICSSAGVSQTRSASEPIQGTYGTYERKVSLTVVPSIADVSIGASGLSITIEHRAGDSAKNWVARLDPLRAALKAVGAPAGGLRVAEDGAGNIVLHFNDRDPFEGVSGIESVYDDERGRSLLGITSTGNQAWITWAGSSGLVIGGVPGSGKTASLVPVFAAMDGKAELHIFDGKAGFDMHSLQPIARTYDRSGDVSAPLETLRKLDHLRVERAEALHSAVGQNNFWNTPLALRKQLGMMPVFVILDEVQTWTDPSGMSKDEKTVSAEIVRLIRTLVQKGRSTGIVCVLTTQKPDATTIPTVIRDNAALKLAFRVSTPEQAITILGSQSQGAPDPTQIPMSAKGRFVMETEGHGIVMGQAGYLDSAEVERRLAVAEPVEDQSLVASRLLGRGTKSAFTSTPDPADEAPARGRDSQHGEFAAPTPGDVPTHGNPETPEALQTAASGLDITSLSIEEREALLRQLLSIPVSAEESAPASAPKAAPKPKTDLKPPSPEGW